MFAGCGAEFGLYGGVWVFTVICFDYCLLWFVMLLRGFGLFVGGAVVGLCV